ncbi:MAG: hypothetical protein AB7P33_13205 [Dehalococcoidia bacterium]
MKAVIPIFLIAILAGVAAFMLLDPLKDRAAAYKAENESVLAELKPPPVAQIVSTEHRSYEDDGITSILNRAKGWTLNIVYGVPEVVTVENVIEFYQANLPAGWTATVTERPGGANSTTGQPNPPLRTMTLVNGKKQATIDLEKLNPGGPHTYEMVIDYQGVDAASDD